MKHKKLIYGSFASTAIVALLSQSAISQLSTPQTTAQAAETNEAFKNKLTFHAEKTENTVMGQRTVHKPMDVMFMIDMSMSAARDVREQYARSIISILDNSLSDDDSIVLAFFTENTQTSYATNNIINVPLVTKPTNRAAVKRLMQEFIDNENIRNEDFYYHISQYNRTKPHVFNEKTAKILVDALRKESIDMYTGYFGGFGEVFDKLTLTNNRPRAVLQYFDSFVTRETFDTNFVSWTKQAKNLKSLMSLLSVSESSGGVADYTIDRLKKSGYSNYALLESTPQYEINKQFENSATEITKRIDVIRSKVVAKIEADDGLTLTKAELVEPSGTRTNLPIKNNKVLYETDDLEEGNYSIEYEFSGDPDVEKSVRSSVTIDGVEKDKHVNTIKTVTTKHETKYEDDPKLLKGHTEEKTKGQDGISRVVTKDGKSSTSIVKEKIDAVILRGTFDENTAGKRETLHYKKEYVANDSLEVGKQQVRTKGKDGYSQTASVNPKIVNNRVVSIESGKSERVEPVNEIIEVGTKPTSKSTSIAFNTKYEGDTSLEYGRRREIGGQQGSSTVMTTYAVDRNSGEVTAHQGEPTIMNAVDKVITLGLKPREERTSVELLPVYEKDETREYGQPNKVVKGSPRVLVTTYPYSLNKETGYVKELAAARKIIDGKPDIIKVAAKDKEEIFTKEGLKVKKVTSYKVDSIRGTVSSASEYRFAESNSLTLVKKEIVTKDNKKLLKVTTYHIDPRSGKITSSTQYQLMTDDDANKYESTKVEVVKRNGHTVEITEHSYIDANTGEIKTEYTEKMLDSTKYDDEGHRIDPPVLDVPVYNGEISDSVETITKDGMKVKKIIRYVVDKDGNVKSEVYYEFENATGSNKSEYSTTEEFEENGVKIRKITKYTIDKDGNIVKTVTYELVDKSNSNAEFDKVERIIKDGKVIERTTHYKFNPNTGNFEMTTTDKELNETNDTSSSKHDSKDQNQNTNQKQDRKRNQNNDQDRDQNTDKESVEIIDKDGVKVKRITYFEKDKNGKLVKKVRYELENANSNGEVVITEEVTENGVKLIKKIIITVDKDGNLVKKVVYELADPNNQQAEFDKIEFFTKDSKLIQRTTHYKFNPLTGKFEETISDKIVSTVDENGQITPDQVKNKDSVIEIQDAKKQKLPKTNVESMLGITLSGLLATAGAAFAKLRKKK